MNDIKKADKIRIRLNEGNKKYIAAADHEKMTDLAEKGQHPYAIIVCCSDSRVVPEEIFAADIGDLFVIRVAGNVLDSHQLGSIEYAADHLECKDIIVLGHTGCGAVHAALKGGGDGYIKYITDDIQAAIGEEKNPYKACCLNVEYAVEKLEKDFGDHPEIMGVRIQGAVYDIKSGEVNWL